MCLLHFVILLLISAEDLVAVAVAQALAQALALGLLRLLALHPFFDRYT